MLNPHAFQWRSVKVDWEQSNGSVSTISVVVRDIEGGLNWYESCIMGNCGACVDSELPSDMLRYISLSRGFDLLGVFLLALVADSRLKAEGSYVYRPLLILQSTSMCIDCPISLDEIWPGEWLGVYISRELPAEHEVPPSARNLPK
jgi:hypothetical protein